MTMTRYVKILTPNAAHYVELIGRKDFNAGFADNERYSAKGWDELRIWSGTVDSPRCIRWRVDPVAAPVLTPPTDFESVSAAQGGFHGGQLMLGEHEWLDLEFHVDSPLTPAEKGVWVRLHFTYDDGSLELKSKFGVGCGFWVDGRTIINNSAPKWLSDVNDRWVYEDDGHPSRGKSLLSASATNAQQLANLIHINPAYKNGDGGYSFAFTLRHDGKKKPAGFDVCTDFVASPEVCSLSPVSGFALRLDAEARWSAPLAADGITLRCEQKENRGGWVLEWREVPGAQLKPAVLTLESLTQAWFSQHAPGMATLRARNRLSFVPTRIRTVDDANFVSLLFDLNVGDTHRLATTQLRTVKLLASKVPLRLHCAGASDIDGKLTIIDVAATGTKSGVNPDFYETLFSWDLTPLANKNLRHQWAIGSVLVSASTLETGSFSTGLAQGGSDYPKTATESALSLTFSNGNYSALSIDPELEFEGTVSVVDRPRPWAVDLTDPQPCRLVISESANRNQSRILTISLKQLVQSTRNVDVVLMDPAPLTIVRLEASSELYGDDSLADYIDDSDQAPEWRFASTKGEVIATLQPQGIGEEMVKGNLHQTVNGKRVAVPEKDKLFGFRLTPVAQLVLDLTDIDLARPEAPWSLRRLMGRRLGVTGIKLDKARFELFYGMGATLEAPGLRVAELDGFIGRVPYAAALREHRVAEKDVDAGKAQQLQAFRASRWLETLWNRPSWWRVYSDLAKRDRLLIESGIQYALRDSRETADPFDIGSFAVPDKVEGTMPPLRGGVDWPFQSKNIHSEFLEGKVSSSGSIENLVFGTLGGEGAQTAAFNNGKTLVITSSRQGRLDSVTLIRVGRIAMLWNKARHVIVYERTTRVAPRYAHTSDVMPEEDSLELQDKFSGVAALRKVREYIEITEARRRYPDSKVERAINGPLAQSVFSTTVVPVSSDWGRDIPDGFVIALRGPVPKDKARSFPDPHVFLDFARAEGKGEGAIAQRIRSTEKLVFFTSTRDEDGGDSDVWPAWPDVDFPLLSPPAPPELPFSSSFAGQGRQPDAAPVELGMGPFTFTLDPAEEAPNLMHDRPGEGLEARITNINLARGLPPRKDDKDLKPVETAARSVGNAHAQMIDGLAELRVELRRRVAGGQKGRLSEHPQLQADVRALLNRLADAAKDVDATVKVTGAPATSWQAQQATRTGLYDRGVTASAQNFSNQLVAQAAEIEGKTAEFKALDGAVEQLLNLAKNKAAALVESSAQQAMQRVSEVSFIPQHALAAFQRLVDGMEHRVTQGLTQQAGKLLTLIDHLEKELGRNPDLAADLEAQWQAAIALFPNELRNLVDVFQNAMNGELGQWFSRLRKQKQNLTDPEPPETLFTRLQAQLEPDLLGAADWLDRWSQTLPPFELGPDFKGMREMVEVVAGQLVAGLLKGVKAILLEQLGLLKAWTDAINKGLEEITTWKTATFDAIAKASSVPDLTDALKAAAASFVTAIQTAAGIIQAALASELPKFEGLAGSLDALGKFGNVAGTAFSNLLQAADGDIEELEKLLQEQAAIVEQYVQASAQQVEQWARDELGKKYEIAKENVNAGLETIRILAEGPVTDTMRATRDLIGYYFHGAGLSVPLTRASAIFNEMGDAALNALNAAMPFDAIGDRLKACIGGMRLGDLFPRFGGIDLTYLIPDLDVPLEGEKEYDWIRVQHGFDKDRLQAWARIWIDKKFDTDATLFDLGPIKLRLLKPRFHAESYVTTPKGGAPIQTTNANLDADFELSLNDQPMMTLRDGSLSFDEKGELKFNFDAEKMEVAEELKFITEALKTLMPEVEGLTITPLLPVGISAAMSFPLPDIGTGAFTMTGITLNTHLDLLISDGFEIRTGLWVSKPERPFGLAILFLGGGGWFGIDASYRPPSRFVTRVSLGIAAGAFIAVNFGFARGSAGLLFTVSVDFYRDWESGSGATAISIGLIVWGEFSVLGIASACMRLVLAITYDGSTMKGTGTFSLRIKICWCFTLRVSQTVTQTFAGSGGSKSAAVTARTHASVDMDLAQPLAPDAGGEALVPLDVDAAVSDYLSSLAIDRSVP